MQSSSAAAPEVKVWGDVAHQEVWETEVPQHGPGAQPLVRVRGQSWGRAPRN